MISRAIYSHYSRPMLDKNVGNAIGWYSEKYFWIGFALSVHYARKTFKEIGFYTDYYGDKMSWDFGIDFDWTKADFEQLDLPASLWSLPKIYAIRNEYQPFLHLDTDVFLTKPLPEHFLKAEVLVQSYEPLDCYAFYERGWKLFLDGGFELSYDFLYGYAHRISPVNNGIVGGNNVDLFQAYCKDVIWMIETNKAKFVNNPIPEYCVTLEQWLLNVFCVRRGVKLQVLLNNLNSEPKELGYKHYLAHSKRKLTRCIEMEQRAKELIPKQWQLINDHFENIAVNDKATTTTI
jgi:hypothetical protein